MLYANVGGIRDPVKQEITLEYCRNQNEDICILSETNINHEQIHQIRNNWLRPFFFSPGDTFSKGILTLLHLGLLDVTEIDSDPNGRFVSFKVALLMKEFFVSMLLLGIVTENNWLGDASLKNYTVI